MNKREKELFKKLCSFKNECFDDSLLDVATPAVLGHLFFNRMQAIAYHNLKMHGLLGKVNREFRNSLKGAYNQNIKKNSSFFQCVEYLGMVLSDCSSPYAMLKGAYLCGMYPEGCRTSNDIDLLVHPRDVSEIGRKLSLAGFSQGHLREGKFEPATRKEIIESKMMRGETVPYIKKVDLPEMEYLEVDINFSVDYKPSDTSLLEDLMKNTVVENIGCYSVRTLSQDDFFIHLCAHMYKEATTLPWVEMMRDMTLYKYCDIYLLLNDAPHEYVDFLFNRAKQLDMEMICAFAVCQMAELFDFHNGYALEVAKAVLSNDSDFIHRVISPKEKKQYLYAEKDLQERLFAISRKSLLQEELSA